MKGIYLLLGSNLGDRQSLLLSAIKHIEERIGKIVQASSIYSTKAWGMEDQPDFLNQVVELESRLDPRTILRHAIEIESILGRKRYNKWGSRIIDIDLLYYGDLVLESKDLVVPHAENENRNFVLVPMVEVAPEFIHPKLQKTQRELLVNCPDVLEVTLFDQGK